MTQCIICNYFEDASTAVRDRQGHVCAVCAVRTTPQQRDALLRGRRMPEAYMDSD